MKYARKMVLVPEDTWQSLQATKQRHRQTLHTPLLEKKRLQNLEEMDALMQRSQQPFQMREQEYNQLLQCMPELQRQQHNNNNNNIKPLQPKVTPPQPPPSPSTMVTFNDGHHSHVPHEMIGNPQRWQWTQKQQQQQQQQHPRATPKTPNTQFPLPKFSPQSHKEKGRRRRRQMDPQAEEEEKDEMPSPTPLRQLDPQVEEEKDEMPTPWLMTPPLSDTKQDRFINRRGDPQSEILVLDYIEEQQQRQQRKKENNNTKTVVPQDKIPLSFNAGHPCTSAQKTELFTLDRLVTGRTPPMYRIKDDHGEVLKGTFYPEEIQPILKSDEGGHIR
ncbi:putative uncharacterized protein DDB_G0294196 [Haliotis rufescens]|uniref:putative uncharacterized protein DDB_G0294196 n=1 Tax=Haliotis rufescens TaxID=6454 RepID=UPI00201F86FD|nr:putative uncharacterized protein DDB_G0294196 [Haliotis rufescens]